MIRKSAVAATLLLILAVGCGGSAGGGVPVDSPSSPLGAGGDAFRECVPDPAGAATTNGWTVLENHSTGTAIIEKVSLIRPGVFGGRYLCELLVSLPDSSAL